MLAQYFARSGGFTLVDYFARSRGLDASTLLCQIEGA